MKIKKELQFSLMITLLFLFFSSTFGMFQDLRVVGHWVPKTIKEHATYDKYTHYNIGEIVITPFGYSDKCVFAQVKELLSNGYYILNSPMEEQERKIGSSGTMGKIRDIELPTQIMSLTFNEDDAYYMSAGKRYDLWTADKIEYLDGIVPFFSRRSKQKPATSELTLQQIYAITDGTQVLIGQNVFKNPDDGTLYLLFANSHKIIKVDSFITSSSTGQWDTSKPITEVVYVTPKKFIGNSDISLRVTTQENGKDCFFSFVEDKKRKRDDFEDGQ